MPGRAKLAASAAHGSCTSTARRTDTGGQPAPDQGDWCHYSAGGVRVSADNVVGLVTGPDNVVRHPRILLAAHLQ